MLALLPHSFSVDPYLCTFLLAAILALMATDIVRAVAKRCGWVTAPSLARHVHRAPVPRIGGVAIYASSWAAAAAFLLVLSAKNHNAANAAAHTLLAIFVPATGIFCIGLVDDFCNLRARTKLAAQMIAGVLLFSSGIGVTHANHLFGANPLSPLLGLPLTVAWVVAITNAFNLIDGLDGLAAGSAFFSTVIVLVVSVLEGSRVNAIITAALAGSILGFLRYNFNPASIFLGDSGSLYIGFMLSAAALADSQKSSTMVAVAIPVVSFGLPILDVTIAIVRRFLRGRPLFEADGDHIHHKLLKRGLSHRDAVLILYAVSALFGLLSMTLYPKGYLTVPVLGIIGLGAFFGVQQLRYHEFSELRRVAHRTLNQLRVISNNIAVRRATEALQSCRTLGDVGAVMEEYLQPLGFDAFALQGNTLDEVPDSALIPFVRKSDDVIYLGQSEPDAFAMRLEFGLAAGPGGRKRSFSVFRASCKQTLWYDGNVFVSSGFVSTLDRTLLLALQSNYWLRTVGEQPQTSEVVVAHAAAVDSVSGTKSRERNFQITEIPV